MKESVKYVMDRFNFTNVMTFLGLLSCVAFLWWISAMTLRGKVPSDVSDIKIFFIGFANLIAGYVWGKSKGDKGSVISGSTNVEQMNVNQKSEEGKQS